jgi:hypothetical protein
MNTGVSTSPTLLREIWASDNHDEAWRTFLERYLPLIQKWCRRAGLNATDADEVSAAGREEGARLRKQSGVDNGDVP